MMRHGRPSSMLRVLWPAVAGESGVCARARLPSMRGRRLSTQPPTPPPAHDRPSAATVKRLAQEAKMQQRMWDTFVPEGGIHFGDRRFWALLSIVLGLHAVNTWREANRPQDSGLPLGAVRRLPDGGLLMEDGSIARGAEATPFAPHTLHKMKEKGEDELVLDRAFRKIKGL